MDDMGGTHGALVDVFESAVDVEHNAVQQGRGKGVPTVWSYTCPAGLWNYVCTHVYESVGASFASPNTTSFTSPDT